MGTPNASVSARAGAIRGAVVPAAQPESAPVPRRSRNDDAARAVEPFEVVDRSGTFSFNATCDGAQKTKHRGALSVAPELKCVSSCVGILGHSAIEAEDCK